VAKSKAVAPATSTVAYNREALAFIKEVSHMSPRMRMTMRPDKTILISHGNDAKSLVFRLVMNATNFAFHSDRLGFYNFQEFYQLLDTFGTPSIEQTEDSLVLKENTTEIVYRLAEPDNLPDSPPEVAFEVKTPLQFMLMEKDIRELRKMTGLIGAEHLHINAGQDCVTLTLGKGMKDHTYKRSFKFDETSKGEPLSFPTTTDIIDQIPLGDYRVGLAKTPATHLARFSLLSSKVSFDVYTGELVDD
jgi:hypothetical protein